MKVQGPLFSLEAHGTIGDLLTFSKRRTGQQVRYQRKQKDAQSVDQVSHRAKFVSSSFACRFFNFGVAFYGSSIFGLSDEIYSGEAEGKTLSEYNLCVADNIPNF